MIDVDTIYFAHKTNFCIDTRICSITKYLKSQHLSQHNKKRHAMRVFFC